MIVWKWDDHGSGAFIHSFEKGGEGFCLMADKGIGRSSRIYMYDLSSQLTLNEYMYVIMMSVLVSRSMHCRQTLKKKAILTQGKRSTIQRVSGFISNNPLSTSLTPISIVCSLLVFVRPPIALAPTIIIISYSTYSDF